MECLCYYLSVHVSYREDLQTAHRYARGESDDYTNINRQRLVRSSVYLWAVFCWIF
jgi:hypothetical protein